MKLINATGTFEITPSRYGVDVRDLGAADHCSVYCELVRDGQGDAWVETGDVGGDVSRLTDAAVAAADLLGRGWGRELRRAGRM